MFAPDNLLLGTSSWSGNDWLASFYPGHLKTRHFIEAYGPEIPRRGNRFVEAESAKWDKLIEDKTPERTVWICKLKMIVR